MRRTVHLQNMRQNDKGVQVINVSFTVGTDISTAFKEAWDLSLKTDAMVSFDFDSVRVTIQPFDEVPPIPDKGKAGGKCEPVYDADKGAERKKW